MRRFLPLLSAIPLIVAFGVVEGVWTDRWQPRVRIEEAGLRLQGLSLVAGEWQGEDDELDARTVSKAEFAGYIYRQYVHRESGVSLTVMVACGKPGPMVAHRPEVCYGSSGHDQIGDAVHEKIERDGVRPADFFRADFRKSNSPFPERLRIYWSWNGGGDWLTSESPRLSFARFPFLYKIYVIRPVLDGDDHADQDPALDFLGVFLPQLQEQLFP